VSARVVPAVTRTFRLAHKVGVVELVLVGLAFVLYYLVPRLENFDFRHQVSNFISYSVYSGWNAVLHGIGYTIVVLILASIFFNDRQV